MRERTRVCARVHVRVCVCSPLGGSFLSPPGRTTVNSRSLPGPERKSSSCLFLSAKIFRITVNMSTLKKKGAWEGGGVEGGLR